MKLKYKKMVIIASIVVMALGFVALVFLDNGTDSRFELKREQRH